MYPFHGPFSGWPRWNLKDAICTTHPINSRPTPSPSHLPPTLLVEMFLFGLTQKARNEGEVLSRTNLHPHPGAHSLLNLQLFLHHHPLPRRWLKSSPFPNPILALLRLSYIPASSRRWPLRSSMSAVCVCQTDGQFPLSAVFPWD
jgi:hypothetical protein